VLEEEGAGCFGRKIKRRKEIDRPRRRWEINFNKELDDLD
jgi:hypothetical protein